MIEYFHFLLFFFLRLGGFKDGVFPGVSLLSLARLSGFPVDFAILLGPGFSGIFLVLSTLIIIFLQVYFVVRCRSNLIIISYKDPVCIEVSVQINYTAAT